MRTVIRNSFTRQTIKAKRVRTRPGEACAECGAVRWRPEGTVDWLYHFYVEDDQGARHSGPLAGGKLFCSRSCCESYTGQAFGDCGERGR